MKDLEMWCYRFSKNQRLIMIKGANTANYALDHALVLNGNGGVQGGITRRHTDGVDIK